MKGKYFQTVAGRSRLLDELGELQKQEIELQHRRATHRQNLGNTHADGDECRNLDNDLSSCIARMKHINEIVSESSGVTPLPTGTDTVQIGSIVTVKKFAVDDSETLYTFQLVGHGESEAKGIGTGPYPALPLISYTCPQGKAVIMKSVGDEIRVGTVDQEIVKIELPAEMKAAKVA